MKYGWLVCAGFVTSVGLWTHGAEAQRTPQGSYLRSCSNPSVQGDTLVANCRRSDGREQRTSLSGVSRCVGDIGNNNGNLQCSTGGSQGGGGSAAPPRGSYQQSCTDAALRGNTLTARCRARDGGYRQTTLPDIRQCRGDIGNNDGRLFCG